MSNVLMELPFTFVIDLYCSKVRTEKDKDLIAIARLKEHYPEHFSAEFAEFIDSAKLTTYYLDQKYEKNFSSIFEPKMKKIRSLQ